MKIFEQSAFKPIIMKKGLGKFEFYLIQLDTILKAATKTKNAALYLFEKDGRTKVFMLEGLAKLYAGMHNEKKFTKIKDSFKALEDLLGAVDYYDSFAKDFANDKKIPAAINKFMLAKKTEKLAELNYLLEKKKWINSSKPRTNKIRKRLAKLDWKNQEQEISLFGKMYKESIATINKFYIANGDSFTNVETQVHELRRKLRWLSIYPQALQGSIQLINSGKADKAVKKYLTKEITTSPFNKMPKQGTHDPVLFLEQNYFLALSFTIAALGKLKDKGLRIYAIAEAIKGTEFISEALAMQKAFKVCGTKETTLDDVLKEAKIICEPFFTEDNLGQMIG